MLFLLFMFVAFSPGIGERTLFSRFCILVLFYSIVLSKPERDKGSVRSCGEKHSSLLYY